MKATKYIIILAAIGLLTSSGLFAQKSSGTGEPPEMKVYIPNAITPDGNGLNDLFRPVISGAEVEIYDLTIFDRRGRIVFHTKDADNAWNGTVAGSEYLTGSNLYVYFLKVKAVNSLETKTYSGHVVTIR